MRLATSAIALVFGCVAGLGAAAQSPPAQDAGSKPSTTVSEKITVTGCLERAEQAATPTTSTPGGSRVTPESFLLINSVTVQGAAGATTYVLEGGDNLKAQLGHRVEIKGTAISSATSVSAGGVPPSPEPHEAGSVTGGTPGTADTPAATRHPRIRVASVRVLGDCSSNR
jgi:hypothetical protein